MLPVENSDGVNEVSPDSGHIARPGSPLDAGGANGSSRLFSLLRHSHIFATAVQDILELKLLREITPCPLTPLQLHLLKLLSLNGQHQVGEVAHFLGVSPPAATKNIDKLARFGLVVRSPCTGDRRATLLSASRKGRRLVREFEKLKAERVSPVLDRFEQQELDTLSGLLERFSVALLDLMCCVKDELGLSVAVAHVVHGISAEATDFAPLVEDMAEGYGVPAYVEELELGAQATETSARQARYDALRVIQRTVGAPYLVTAHHRDDQVETTAHRATAGSNSRAPLPSRSGSRRSCASRQKASTRAW